MCSPIMGETLNASNDGYTPIMDRLAEIREDSDAKPPTPPPHNTSSAQTSNPAADSPM